RMDLFQQWSLCSPIYFQPIIPDELGHLLSVPHNILQRNVAVDGRSPHQIKLPAFRCIDDSQGVVYARTHAQNCSFHILSPHSSIVLPPVLYITSSLHKQKLHTPSWDMQPGVTYYPSPIGLSALFSAHAAGQACFQSASARHL